MKHFILVFSSLNAQWLNTVMIAADELIVPDFHIALKLRSFSYADLIVIKYGIIHLFSMLCIISCVVPKCYILQLRVCCPVIRVWCPVIWVLGRDLSKHFLWWFSLTLNGSLSLVPTNDDWRQQVMCRIDRLFHRLTHRNTTCLREPMQASSSRHNNSSIM